MSYIGIKFGPEVSIIYVFVHCEAGNFACQQMPAKKDTSIRTIPPLWGFGAWHDCFRVCAWWWGKGVTCRPGAYLKGPLKKCVWTIMFLWEAVFQSFFWLENCYLSVPGRLDSDAGDTTISGHQCQPQYVGGRITSYNFHVAPYCFHLSTLIMQSLLNLPAFQISCIRSSVETSGPNPNTWILNDQ